MKRDKSPDAQSAGVVIPGGSGTPELRGPEGMSQEDIKYRMLLQEAILWVSRSVLEERRDEITKRAEDRVRTLMELRGS